MNSSNVRIETSYQRNNRGKLIRHLVIDNIIWMSDSSDEYEDIDRAIEKAHGNCFIAGLGLGVIVEELLKKKNISTITVVEINDNIIRATGNYLGFTYNGKFWEYKNIVRIFHGDALKNFFADKSFYDYVYADIYLEPTAEAKVQVDTIFNNIKPYTKENAIFEAWHLPKLQSGEFWS